MPLPDLPRLLTLEHAAQLLRISVLDLQRAIGQSDLPLAHVDGDVFIDTDCLLEELGVRMPCRVGTRLPIVHSLAPQGGL